VKTKKTIKKRQEKRIEGRQKNKYFVNIPIHHVSILSSIFFFLEGELYFWFTAMVELICTKGQESEIYKNWFGPTQTYA